MMVYRKTSFKISHQEMYVALAKHHGFNNLKKDFLLIKSKKKEQKNQN